MQLLQLDSPAWVPRPSPDTTHLFTTRGGGEEVGVTGGVVTEGQPRHPLLPSSFQGCPPLGWWVSLFTPA